jgi:hypothetical protein
MKGLKEQQQQNDDEDDYYATHHKQVSRRMWYRNVISHLQELMMRMIIVHLKKRQNKADDIACMPQCQYIVLLSAACH